MDKSERITTLARVSAVLTRLIQRAAKRERYPGPKVMNELLNGSPSLGDQQEIIAIAAMISASETQA